MHSAEMTFSRNFLRKRITTKMRKMKENYDKFVALVGNILHHISIRIKARASEIEQKNNNNKHSIHFASELERLC